MEKVLPVGILVKSICLESGEEVIIAGSTKSPIRFCTNFDCLFYGDKADGFRQAILAFKRRKSFVTSCGPTITTS